MKKPIGPPSLPSWVVDNTPSRVPDVRTGGYCMQRGCIEPTFNGYPTCRLHTCVCTSRFCDHTPNECGAMKTVLTPTCAACHESDPFRPLETAADAELPPDVWCKEILTRLKKIKTECTSNTFTDLKFTANLASGASIAEARATSLARHTGEVYDSYINTYAKSPLIRPPPLPTATLSADTAMELAVRTGHVLPKYDLLHPQSTAVAAVRQPLTSSIYVPGSSWFPHPDWDESALAWASYMQNPSQALKPPLPAHIPVHILMAGNLPPLDGGSSISGCIPSPSGDPAPYVSLTKMPDDSATATSTRVRKAPSQQSFASPRSVADGSVCNDAMSFRSMASRRASPS